jgi:hypothetical protein
MRKWLKRIASQAILAATILIAWGCSSQRFREASEALGLVDADPPAPLVLDIVCDHSRGAPCTRGNLNALLNNVLPEASDRPRSVVRLWMQGDNFGTTQQIAERRVAQPSEPGRQAKAKYSKQWTKSSATFLMAAAEPYFKGKGPATSPIAEAFSKIALAGGRPGYAHSLVVITDGRQVSRFLGDFECGRLPTSDQFVRNLQSAGVLPPGSLSGTRVYFSYMSDGPIDADRCAATAERAEEIRALWSKALARAGVAQVCFSVSSPAID